VNRERQAGTGKGRQEAREYVLVTAREVLQNKMGSESVMCKTRRQDAGIMAQS